MTYIAQYSSWGAAHTRNAIFYNPSDPSVGPDQIYSSVPTVGYAVNRRALPNVWTRSWSDPWSFSWNAIDFRVFVG